MAGIDEAGRGPLAGPVCAAAVLLSENRIPKGIDDSKSLTRENREILFAELVESAHLAVGYASVEEIDRINILQATMLAMQRAAVKLPVPADYFLVDGNRLPVDLPAESEALIGGDRRSLAVAAASIVAKVTRDRLMARLAKAFPQYGWERNSGYGTREHRDALKQFGPTPHHRHSFAPLRDAAKQAVG